MIPGISADAAPLWLEAIKRVQTHRLDDFSYGEGRLFHRALDRVAARLAAPTPQQAYDAALDARVKVILSGEPYKSQREQMAKDRKLFEDAMKYADYSMHLNWEIKNHGALGFKEPPQGCPDCKSAYDEYMSGIKNTRLEHAYDELSHQTDLLNSAHTRYMERLRRARPTPKMVFRAGGYAEEPKND